MKEVLEDQREELYSTTWKEGQRRALARSNFPADSEEELKEGLYP